MHTLLLSWLQSNAALAAAISTGAGVGLSDLANQIIGLISWKAFFLATLSIMVASFRLFTSGGSPEAYTAAKKHLLYVFMGVFFLTFAVVLVRLVTNILQP